MHKLSRCYRWRQRWKEKRWGGGGDRFFQEIKCVGDTGEPWKAVLRIRIWRPSLSSLASSKPLIPLMLTLFSVWLVFCFNWLRLWFVMSRLNAAFSKHVQASNLFIHNYCTLLLAMTSWKCFVILSPLWGYDDPLEQSGCLCIPWKTIVFQSVYQLSPSWHRTRLLCRLLLNRASLSKLSKPHPNSNTSN